MYLKHIKSSLNSIRKEPKIKKGKIYDQIITKKGIHMANKHLKRHSTSTLGECKSEIQWDGIRYLLKCPKFKWLTIPSDGEKVEPLECSYTVDGHVKWYNFFA